MDDLLLRLLGAGLVPVIVIVIASIALWVGDPTPRRDDWDQRR